MDREQSACCVTSRAGEPERDWLSLALAPPFGIAQICSPPPSRSLVGIYVPSSLAGRSLARDSIVLSLFAAAAAAAGMSDFRVKNAPSPLGALDLVTNWPLPTRSHYQGFSLDSSCHLSRPSHATLERLVQDLDLRAALQ